jgi:hypothetical protein
MKNCLKCGIEFMPNGHQQYCSTPCMRSAEYIRNKPKINLSNRNNYYRNRDSYLNRVKEYSISNKSKIKEYKKQYRELNREKLKLVDKEYYTKNKPILMQKAKVYLNKRYKNDMDFMIKCRLKKRVQLAVKKYSEEKRIINSKDFRLKYKNIIEHLKPFPKDISKYHIDHIRPLCSFNLNKEEDIIKAFAPENHQWLLAEDNLKKGGKWDGI